LRVVELFECGDPYASVSGFDLWLSEPRLLHAADTVKSTHFRLFRFSQTELLKKARNVSGGYVWKNKILEGRFYARQTSDSFGVRENKNFLKRALFYVFRES